MYTVFKTLVQITITTNVLAFNFESFMKSLPVPADLKDIMFDMYNKEPELNMTNLEDLSLMDFKSTTPFIARKSIGLMKPTSTVVTTTAGKLNKPVMPTKGFLKSSITLRPYISNCILKLKTTVKPPEQTIPPPVQHIHMPIPMQFPIYASVPLMMPMRSYFEPVKHDHPPLHKIKSLIEKEEKKWKEENGESGKESSVEIAYSDTSSEQNIDTDTETDTDDSEHNDVGHEYYDDVIKINA